jgi:hypothetical protein
VSLTRNEIVQLLAMVTALDGTDTDDELTVSAWHKMSQIGEWESLEAAERALLVYRNEQPDYPLRPGHITKILERVRASSSASFQLAIERVPESVRNAADFDAEYLAWVKDSAARHRAEHMTAFARGERPGPRAIEA